MTSEHVLYGYKGSGSAAVEAALELAGLPFRTVNAASWDAKSELEELRRVSPLLQIPALRFPDGTAMTESAAILIELGLRNPASRLLPAAPAARAQSIRGLVYIAANCYSAIGIIDFPERYTTANDPLERDRVKAGSQRRLHEMWTSFADAFVPQPFLAGESVGALDLLAAVVSRWSGARVHLKAVRPEFAAHVEAVEKLPALKPVFERHWPAAA